VIEQELRKLALMVVDVLALSPKAGHDNRQAASVNPFQK
jgi:hypothetical protein